MFHGMRLPSDSSLMSVVREVIASIRLDGGVNVPIPMRAMTPTELRLQLEGLGLLSENECLTRPTSR